MPFGWLSIYMGPMFSHKTSRLISDLSIHSQVGDKVLYIVHKGSEKRNVTSSTSVPLDGRYEISTHNPVYNKLPSEIHSKAVNKLSEVDITNYSVIGIDESQFFDDLEECVIKWLDSHKRIICSGLDGSSSRKPMGSLLKLIPHADKVIKLCAKCYYCAQNKFVDLQDAPFTLRITNHIEEKVIGGGDIYKPVCRYHYNNHKEKISPFIFIKMILLLFYIINDKTRKDSGSSNTVVSNAK